MRPAPIGCAFCVPLSKDLIVKMTCLRWSRKLAPLVPPIHREVPSTSVSKRPSVAVVDDPEANGEAPVGRDVGENPWPRSCCLAAASGTTSWRLLSKAAHLARRSSSSLRGIDTLSTATGYWHGSRLAETHWAQGRSPEHLMRRRLQLLHLGQTLAKSFKVERGSGQPRSASPRMDGWTDLGTRQERIPKSRVLTLLQLAFAAPAQPCAAVD